MKRALLFASLILLCGLSPLRAQTITSVTGTILDPEALPYASGTVTATLVGAASGVSPILTATGASVLSPSTAQMDNGGKFSLGLVANGSITPASTTYSFRFCAPALQPPLASTNQSCFSITGVTVAGSSQDISTTANASAVSLVRHWIPTRVYATAGTAGVASITATTMTTAPTIPASGRLYNLSGYVTQTVLGASCAGNSTVVLNLIYQDPNAAAPQTQAIGTFTVTTNGTLGIVPLTANAYAGAITFVAKAGTVVQFSTTYTAGGSCSPAPTVQVFPVLELM